MQVLAQRKNVHAEWQQKLSNKFGSSEQFVQLSKTNVYILHVLVRLEGRFRLKSDAGNKFESSWAQVVQKVWKKIAKMKAQGRFLEHFGLRLTASGGSEPLRGRCGRHSGVRRLIFLYFFGKV